MTQLWPGQAYMGRCRRRQMSLQGEGAPGNASDQLFFKGPNAKIPFLRSFAGD